MQFTVLLSLGFCQQSRGKICTAIAPLPCVGIGMLGKFKPGQFELIAFFNPMIQIV